MFIARSVGKRGTIKELVARGLVQGGGGGVIMLVGELQILLRMEDVPEMVGDPKM